MTNPETAMTLDQAVAEVFGILTGLDLEYEPEQDRYQAIVRQINRALRGNALEHEWSWYSSTETVGTTYVGQRELLLRSNVRARMINDDAVRFVDTEVDRVRMWAYFLPRDAGHKYEHRRGMWATVTRNTLTFSRALVRGEEGLDIQVPVMREPRMFRLPSQPEDPDADLVEVPDSIRNQLVDFEYPDLVCLRAAWYYAQTDPVMQPRVQTLEAMTKDLMYQIIERDDRMTDSPYENTFIVPIQPDLFGVHDPMHWHPHADTRW